MACGNRAAPDKGNYAMFASFDFGRHLAGFASVVTAVVCIVAAAGPAVSIVVA